MQEFKSKDYKDILYPVFSLKNDTDIFSAFPRLNEYEEFRSKLPTTTPFDKVFKYIVYAYDKKSPFFLNIEDLIERKKLAVLQAGFEVNARKSFNEQVRAMLNCENIVINKMIIRYCRMQSKEFTSLVASQEAFYQINLQLMTVKEGDEDPVKTAKEKAALDKSANEFNERLDEKARRFLSQETSEIITQDLWNMAEEEAVKILLTPEDYAL